MNKRHLILFLLFIISGFFYYNLLVIPQNSQEVFVARVTDGDTFETATGERVRLKGINTPEKSEELYLESKEFLIKEIENTAISITGSKKDRYNRILAHTKANKLLLENGLAYLYYYEKDSNYNSLRKAEEEARKSGLGLWKTSPNSHCLTLIDLKYKETPKRCTGTEQLIIQNTCNKDIQVTIKDDATHIYKENIEANNIFTKNFSCIWNNDGDSLYVRDDKGLLIFYRYN